MSKLSALEQFLLKHGGSAAKWVGEHPAHVAGGLAAAGLGTGAAVLGPDLATSAMEHLAEGKIKRSVRHAADDTADFVGKHPLVAAGALGGAGMLGAGMNNQSVHDAVGNMGPLMGLIGNVVGEEHKRRR